MADSLIGRIVEFPIDRVTFVEGRITKIISEDPLKIEVVPTDDPKEIWIGYEYQVSFV